MITTYLYALASVLLVSLISLVGVFTLSLKEETIKKYIGVFIGLAIGALLGDAFIHIIPEAFEQSTNSLVTSFLIIAGILIFFVLEKFLHWHHHGEDATSHEIHPAGKLVLISDGVHNLIDGIIIGASFLISIPIGIATTIAVILHEIPQEIGDFAVLIHSGYSKTRALWLNFISALVAVVGVLFALIMNSVAQNSIAWLLPIAAGGFIYIAVADLIPELHKHQEDNNSLLQIFATVLGVGLMIFLTFLE